MPFIDWHRRLSLRASRTRRRRRLTPLPMALLFNLVPSERRWVRIDVGVNELGDDPTGTCLSDGRTKN